VIEGCPTLLKGDQMEEHRRHFKNGFVIGMLTALFMAVVISCSYSPLEAGGANCGESWNPCYVKIVD